MYSYALCDNSAGVCVCITICLHTYVCMYVCMCLDLYVIITCLHALLFKNFDIAYLCSYFVVCFSDNVWRTVLHLVLGVMSLRVHRDKHGPHNPSNSSEGLLCPGNFESRHSAEKMHRPILLLLPWSRSLPTTSQTLNPIQIIKVLYQSLINNTAHDNFT